VRESNNPKIDLRGNEDNERKIRRKEWIK